MIPERLHSSPCFPLNSCSERDILATSPLSPEVALEPTTEPKPKKKKKGLPAWVTILTLLVVIGGVSGAILVAYLP